MNKREALMNFIDAVISGDDENDKKAFSVYTQANSREFFGTDKATKAPLITEGEITPLIDISGDNVISVRDDEDGKFEVVGQVIYEDDGNDSEDMIFVGKDGKKVKLGDGSAQELVAFIEKKFLGAIA